MIICFYFCALSPLRILDLRHFALNFIWPYSGFMFYSSVLNTVSCIEIPNGHAFMLEPKVVL